jgi:hypothetical protein
VRTSRQRSPKDAARMAYDITYWAKPYVHISGKSTVRKETADEAWHLVEGLMASNVEVEISSPSGVIHWRELKRRAET